MLKKGFNHLLWIPRSSELCRLRVDWCATRSPLQMKLWTVPSFILSTFYSLCRLFCILIADTGPGTHVVVRVHTGYMSHNKQEEDVKAVKEVWPQLVFRKVFLFGWLTRKLMNLQWFCGWCHTGVWHYISWGLNTCRGPLSHSQHADWHLFGAKQWELLRVVNQPTLSPASFSFSEAYYI